MRLNLPTLITDSDTRATLLYTLAYLFLFRMGLHVLLPVIAPEFVYSNISGSVDPFFEQMEAEPFWLTDISLFSILALGIGPYYLATWLTPLLVHFFRGDSLPEMKRAQLNLRWTRILTVLIASVQAISYTQTAIIYYGEGASSFSFVSTWLLLILGAVLCMWMAERISARGLMDGRALLLTADLIFFLPIAFVREIGEKLEPQHLLNLGLEVFCWLLLLIGILALTQAARQIPVEIKEKESGSSREGTLLIPFSIVDEYPLALGASILVAPVFFFSMVEMVSHLIFKAGDMEYPVWLELLDNPFSVAYWLLLVPAVIMGTHWLVNVLVKPKHYTDALQLYGATLKGVEPGEATTAYLRKVIRQMTLPLSICLALISVLPSVLIVLFEVTPLFHNYFDGFYLFLIVSLITDFIARWKQGWFAHPSAETPVLGRSRPVNIVEAPEVLLLLESEEE
jgi:preprotein translocase subunit SecY